MKSLLIFILPFFSINLFASDLTELTPNEILEVGKRLDGFYSWPLKPEAMDVQGTKTDPETGVPIISHTELFGGLKSHESPLLFQAQLKATQKYREWYCRAVLKKISPHFPCGEKRFWGDFQRDDRVSDLTESWVKDVTYSPDEIPVKGESDRPLWSDDYWAMQQGLTSYRYSEGTWFEDYRAAIASYSQPQAWLKIGNLSPEKIKAEIVRWSPSEKYDLSIQDITFSLTNEQKKEGEWYQNEEGEVEGWMGLCHGWAPASIMVPRPEKPVEWPGPQGTSVLWYPNDIKAMLTLAWANGEWESNFVGRRCEQKKVKTFPNGRINSQDCFDNNPATFHLALGNMIGKEKASFVMDKAYDYQVWNQPIVGYQFEYFNPLKPETKSKTWSEVAVDYDEKFKKQDRFQTPLTRGKFREGSERLRNLRLESQDAHIEKVVGVIATVVYLVETTPPDFGPRPGRDNYGRDVLLYDLEIAKIGDQWMITGGEWHQNNHPDFLFVPRKDSAARAYWDIFEEDPSVVGPQASRKSGYPLCKILKSLVEGSASKSVTYNCSVR
ncbi:MAG: hypothetical protein EBQ92_09685 [Proteobacteria bacterium]|nr:hypothetical protein [Pseudomonadota bacterium]